MACFQQALKITLPMNSGQIANLTWEIASSQCCLQSWFLRCDNTSLGERLCACFVWLRKGHICQGLSCLTEKLSGRVTYFVKRVVLCRLNYWTQNGQFKWVARKIGVCFYPKKFWIEHASGIGSSVLRWALSSHHDFFKAFMSPNR